MGAAASALLATAVLLVPGAAQARDECGTLTNGAITCADASAPYVFGIRYDVSNGNNGGIAGDVAVTFVGGSVTTVPSAPTTGWGSAIVIRTDRQTDTTSRTITLSAGVGANAGNAVAITQSGGSLTGSYDNTGIVIHQRGARADATTVTLGSGVTIGTMTTPMKNHGVHVWVDSSANAGTHTMTSAATIYSTNFGMLMDNRGGGNSVITNTGSIVTEKSGIRVRGLFDTSGGVGDQRTADTRDTVTNSGSIVVSAAAGRGIEVDAEGLGLYRTVNSGTISASGASGHGVFVNARWHMGAAGTAAVEVENSGAITTTGADGYGIHIETADAMAPQGRGDGNVAITNSGTISSANFAILVNSKPSAMGNTTVKHTGGSITSTAADGIRVRQGGTGTVTIESGADIEAENHGIFVISSPTTAATVTVAAGVTTRAAAVTVAAGTTTTTYATLGAVSVTHSGGDIEAKTESGIWVQQGGADATVASSADVTAKKYGIFVDNRAALATRVITAAGVTTDTYATTGAVSVTHSAGDIEAETEAGIGAQNVASNPDAVTVTVSGGTVTTEGQSKPAVQILQRGTGDAVAGLSSGATLTSKHNAGIYADLSHADNAAGQVKIEQAGTIAARKGVYARVGRASAMDETRAATAQPLVDVTWTGSFSHGTTATVAPNDDDRFLARDVAHAVAVAQEVEAEKAMRPDGGEGGHLRYGSPAGIEAQVMSWRDVMTAVAKGDDPGAFADAAAADALFADNADTAAVVAAFKAVLANGDLDDIPGALTDDADDNKVDDDGDGTITDAEIIAYLSADDADRRTLLRNVLAQSFTEAEKAVLRAVATNTGLTDAVLDAALPAGATDEEKTAYRTAVRDLLKRYNVGNIKVAMTGGSIVASRGDGIRAYYATPHAMNGEIDVTIAAGTTVTGAMAGIYVANAGAMGTGAERILKQTVTVDGIVTGGSDAAVHLVGGGKLTVGEMGKLVAGSSGRAILVNEPGRSVIVIDGEVRGGKGAGPDATAAVDTTGGGSITLGRTGSVVLNEGATDAIRADGAPGSTDIILVTDGPVYRESADAAVQRLGGKIVGNAVDEASFAPTDGDGTTGMVREPVLLKDGVPDTSGIPEPPPPGTQPPAAPAPEQKQKMACNMASDDRCRLYEALPSVLLSMNGLPTYQERMASARSEAGGWARVETARGEWEADSSTRSNVAYERSRTGVRAGVDTAVGESTRAGVSVHGLRGSAEMTQNGGKTELSGMGVGVYGTAMVGNGVYVDAQAAVTRYDVELTSMQGRTLKDGANGMGYALAVEAGRPMALEGNLTVTPRAGLVWSRVSLGDFTDSRGARGTPVSVDDAGSLMGRAGVGLEMAPEGGLRVFGSVDAVHEFSAETEATVGGTSLKASAKTTGVRVGLGAVHGWGEGRYSLAGSASYATGGGVDGEFGGALSLSVRF